tara:strand:- start:627 stop:1250 length:624 start_codon:yes stop_codon:yes gene_type:complete
MTRSKVNLIFFFNIIIFIFCTAFCFKSVAAELKKETDIISIGSKDAVVKIKIFSSLTCPHCADFHMSVIPKIKKEFVESGKVQLIFVDFPLNQAAFNASKLLNCVDKEKQMNFLDIVYKKQNEWTSASTLEEINKNLKEIVKNLGISATEFDKCLINEIISDKILNGRIEAVKKYSIEATPTIVINEKKLEGSANFKNIKKKIEKLI